MNLLKKYIAKRDFKKTSEPKGKREKTKTGNSYLIQKHQASHLHYDFRLELDGTLKSWAVTKGPSLDPSVKRLAVEVEDHPVSYGKFEGTIPKGQYGGGTVMLWDVGTWELVGENAEEQLKKGNLKIVLHGERLKGEWHLVRMKWSEKEGKHNWLLMKKDDEFAKAGDDDKLLKKAITSIVTGRTMSEIAEGKNGKKVWNSNKESTSKEIIKKPTAKGKLKFTYPELATLVDKTPQNKEWIHEIKYDGYRIQAIVENGIAKMFTRNGLDWTEKFLSIADSLEKLPIKNAVFDGEIVVLDKNSRSNFLKLQEVLKGESDEELQYYIFDLLHLDDQDLKGLALIERKEKLEKVLSKNKLKNIFYSEHFAFRGDEFFQKICSLNYEGLVSKLADKPYFSGRNKYWVKSKCHKRQEMVIGGFTLPEGKTKSRMPGIGALLIGVYEGDNLIYSGRVGTGFNVKTSIELRQKLERLKQKESPFKSVSTLGKKGAIWVKPSLVCEVEFAEWTPDGSLRHPSFQGLRSDKPAKEIYKEKPVLSEEESKKKITSEKKEAIISGIKITHPDRIIYPAPKLTKEDLANYYDQISDYILPHIQNRLISLVRCPEGIAKECFFQRHEIIHSEFIHELKTEKTPYIYIKDKKGLLTLAQFGVIEIHIWGSTIKDILQPDRIVFDLDPDPSVPWKKVLEAAAEVKLRMDDLGLKSFVQTTGGKGLHVIVPIQPKHDWKTIKAFTKNFAENMQSDSPDRYVTNMNKEKRKGKIFIDYLRNDHSSTAIATFSARARENATVATPISWHELNENLNPQNFTIKTIPERLKKLKSDPWQEFLNLKQNLKL